MTINNEITWKRLIVLEPRLENLRKRAEIDRIKGIPEDKIEHIWYKEYRQTMKDFVGFCANNKIPLLMSTEAYDVAYHILYFTLTGTIII